jgi:hypothetical protein
LAEKGASLYLYLLIDSHEADQAKVLAALTAYVCEVTPFQAGPQSSGVNRPHNVGLYIVPVTNADRQYGPGDAARLMTDYDYIRANEMLVQFAHNGLMREQDLTPTGIYLAGFNVAFPERPTAHAIYEISGLRTDTEVRDWMITQQQALEVGNVPSTEGVTHVPPSFSSIFAGLGVAIATVAHITTPAQVETIACR